MVAALAIAFALFAVPAAAAPAPTGCAGKPGSPNRAALLQYCPKKAGSSSPAGGTASGASQQAATPTTGGGKHQDAKAAATDKPQLPLTDYPSSGGINLLLILLILVALGLGVAYGARRWRRSRPQAS